MPARHDRAALAFVFVSMLAIASAVAQNAVASKQSEADARAAALRAMVVLKIAPYLTLEQPPAARKEYRIGVIGSDAVAAAIQKELPGKKVGELPVVVVAVDADTAAKTSTAHGCDLLWIAKSIDAPTQKLILAAHAAQPTALIAEHAGFAAAGGSVQLFVQDNGIKFEVNGEALKQQGMRASPQLSKLSRKGPTQ